MLRAILVFVVYVIILLFAVQLFWSSLCCSAAELFQLLITNIVFIMWLIVMYSETTYVTAKYRN